MTEPSCTPSDYFLLSKTVIQGILGMRVIFAQPKILITVLLGAAILQTFSSLHTIMSNNLYLVIGLVTHDNIKYLPVLPLIIYKIHYMNIYLYH